MRFGDAARKRQAQPKAVCSAARDMRCVGSVSTVEWLEDVHALFKAQVSAARPQVDLERVATGEHWYGTQALELKLVDELRTSDDFLLEAAAERDLYHVAYKRRRPLTERVLGGVDALLGRGTP